MLHYRLRVQALILLSIFLTGGFICPLAHKLTCHHGHEQQASDPNADAGVHLDQQAEAVFDDCLQCVRHSGLFHDFELVTYEFRTAESYDTSHRGVLESNPILGHWTRGPPAASS